MTNFTADHTAMLWKGVMRASLSSGPSAPLAMDRVLIFTLSPVAQMSNDPELSFCGMNWKGDVS